MEIKKEKPTETFRNAYIKIAFRVTENTYQHIHNTYAETLIKLLEMCFEYTVKNVPFVCVVFFFLFLLFHFL